MTSRTVAALTAGAWFLLSIRDGGPLAKGRVKENVTLSGSVRVAGTDDGIRDALVSLSDVRPLAGSQLVTTDSNGRFEFRDLPRGEYRLIVSHPLYVGEAYGATPANDAGSVVEVSGESARIVLTPIQLHRSGAVFGTICDTEGRPIPSIGVSAEVWRRDPTTGEPVLETYLPKGPLRLPVETDSRGSYRLHGLAPGNYLLKFSRLVDNTTATPTTTALAPAYYYPGALAAAEAFPIVVQEGGETGVGAARLGAIPIATLDGNVFSADGSILSGQAVSIRSIDSGGAPFSRAVRTGANGAFQFSGLAAGNYELRAISRPTQQPAGESALVGVTDVFVAGDTRADVYLSPVQDFEGVVVPDQTTPLKMLRGLRISFQRIGAPTSQPERLEALMKPDGRFQLSGVSAGNYRVLVAGSRLDGGPVFVRSVVRGQTDLLDGFLEVKVGERSSELRVLLGAFNTEISGAVSDANGNICSDCSVVLFPTDRTFWRFGSRRIRQAPVSSAGRFRFLELPEGEYRVIAIRHLEAAQWFDAKFLETIAGAADGIDVVANRPVQLSLRSSN